MDCRENRRCFDRSEALSLAAVRNALSPLAVLFCCDLALLANGVLAKVRNLFRARRDFCSLAPCNRGVLSSLTSWRQSVECESHCRRLMQCWGDDVAVCAESSCSVLTTSSDYRNVLLTHQAGVEVCLQLGKLGMGRDALLAAILGGVLRPETSKEHSTHPGFGRAPVTLVDIREGFGKNVARLVAGLEHATCVEETAHAVLKGTAGSASDRTHASIASGSSGSENAGDGGTMAEDEDSEPLSPAMLIGVREGMPGGAGRGGVRGAKASSLREASALEQVSSIENESGSRVPSGSFRLRILVNIWPCRLVRNAFFPSLFGVIR